jgi:alpha-glucosidase
MRILRTLAIAACLALHGSLPAAAADAVSAHDATSTIEVTALSDDVLRVRIGPGAQLPEDASWAVPASVRATRLPLQSAEREGQIEFRTRDLVVRLGGQPLRLLVTDTSGRPISTDAAATPVAFSNGGFTLNKTITESEHFFALGDKTGSLDRRGGTFVDWNSDSYGFTESTDPIYKSIPFFISVGGAGGSYGIFLDNTYRAWFDFAHRDPETLALGAPGGPIDYYLIYGPSIAQVVERYTQLTGRPPLPPLWSLGFQQSRYSYMSATEVRRIASTLRADRIPADVIYLDIDYQDRNRPFTVNPSTFPDLAGLARDLRSEGIRLIGITDLHIAAAPNQRYAPYDSGVAGDHFIKRADGSLYVGKVWPGPTVFPDFTRSATRAWWGTLYRGFVEQGIAGYWNDMNEPAIFNVASKTMPLDNQHRIDEPGFAPRIATHEEIHNIYGMENSRATFDGLRALSPDERPYVLTRATFAGGQRYAATWTGDNSSTWNQLKLSISMLLNLGLSGFAYSGADVGGFIGSPSPQLMTRWIEIAAFTPYFRAHTAKDTPRKEPWEDGPLQLDIRRRYIEQRYRLLPYFYALADENSRTGAPLMRPVFYEFPQTIAAPCDAANTFLLGSRLLVAPSPDLESPGRYEVCLPKGGWYDFWTGAKVDGSTHPEANGTFKINVRPTLEQLPIFVRAGAILPSQPLVQSTADTPQGPLTLDVYPGEDCSGQLYWDDGHSEGFTRGEFRRQRVTCALTAQGIDIHFDPAEGRYTPWWQAIRVRIHDWRGAARATLDGAATPAIETGRADILEIMVPDAPSERELRIEHAATKAR